MRLERVRQIQIRETSSPWLGHDNQVIPGQGCFTVAKVFPYQAFDTISVHRTAGMFLCYGETKTSNIAAAIVCQHGKILVATS